VNLHDLQLLFCVLLRFITYIGVLQCRLVTTSNHQISKHFLRMCHCWDSFPSWESWPAHWAVSLKSLSRTWRAYYLASSEVLALRFVAVKLCGLQLDGYQTCLKVFELSKNWFGGVCDGFDVLLSKKEIADNFISRCVRFNASCANDYRISSLLSQMSIWHWINDNKIWSTPLCPRQLNHTPACQD